MDKQKLINYIAYYMYFVGTQLTNYGNYVFYLDELSKEIGCEIDFLRDNYYEICNILEKHKGVIDVWGEEETEEECFDVNFGTAYCGVEDDE